MAWNGSNADDAHVAHTSGYRGASRRRAAASGGRGRLWAMLALILCAAVIGGIAWRYFGGDSSPRPADEPTQAAKPPAKEPVRATPKKQEPQAASNEVQVVRRERYLGQDVVSHTFVTNATGRSVRETIVTADGKKHGRTTVIAKPTFKYGTDQMLSEVLFPPQHGQLAPWPEMDAKAIDREFAQSLLDPIVILDDDPEEVRIRKEAVRQARSEMAKLVKEGHSVLDIIQWQRDGNEHAHEMQLEVSRELHRLRREGASAAEIRDYLDKSNQILEQHGIEAVPEPEKKGRRQ